MQGKKARQGQGRLKAMLLAVIATEKENKCKKDWTDSQEEEEEEEKKQRVRWYWSARDVEDDVRPCTVRGIACRRYQLWPVSINKKDV